MPNSQLKASKVPFQTTQHQFASYIRNPQTHKVPDNIKPERMAVYRELFFNNVESFLSSGFPVLRRILTDAQWYELAQDFFSRHQCETPYFSEISEEFLTFLQNERNNSDDYPFMLELAHYEWVEMALSIAQDSLPPIQEAVTDFLPQQLKVSPLAWSLAYQYPVHQISPEFLPTEAPTQPTLLCVYRNWDDEVGFIQISAITFRLLELIEQQPELTLAECLQQVAVEAQHPNPELVMSSGLEIVEKLIAKGILILS